MLNMSLCITISHGCTNFVDGGGDFGGVGSAWFGDRAAVAVAGVMAGADVRPWVSGRPNQVTGHIHGRPAAIGGTDPVAGTSTGVGILATA